MVDLPASFGPWTITTPVSGRFSSFRWSMARKFLIVREWIRIWLLRLLGESEQQVDGVARGRIALRGLADELVHRLAGVAGQREVV